MIKTISYRLKNIILNTSLLIIIIAFNFAHNPPGGWYQQFMPPEVGNAEISNITFTDSLTGYAVTANGVINDSGFVIKTTNSGDNWFIIFQTLYDLNKIQFINENTGYICGGLNNGAVLFETTNSGNNWNTLNIPAIDMINIKGMSVKNEDTIWISESTPLVGGLYRTTNGGQNWERQFGGISGNPDKVYFYDANLGFINNGVGNNILRRTTDGGMTWTEIPGVGGFTDIEFIDENTGWKALGNMMLTTDGGLNWTAQQIPSGGNIIVSPMDQFKYVNQDTIWGIGGYAKTEVGVRGILYRTTNSGLNWYFQIPDSTINIFKYFHVNFINVINGWAYSPKSGIHTLSGGDTTFLNIQQISSLIPTNFNLYQNYPNPFNPITKIRYELRVSSYASLKVYDILGKEVATLVNQKQNAGSYEVEFNGGDFSGGVYFYTLRSDEFVQTRRMVLIK